MITLNGVPTSDAVSVIVVAISLAIVPDAVGFAKHSMFLFALHSYFGA